MIAHNPCEINKIRPSSPISDFILRMQIIQMSDQGPPHLLYKQTVAKTMPPLESVQAFSPAFVHMSLDPPVMFDLKAHGKTSIHSTDIKKPRSSPQA